MKTRFWNGYPFLNRLAEKESVNDFLPDERHRKNEFESTVVFMESGESFDSLSRIDPNESGILYTNRLSEAL